MPQDVYVDLRYQGIELGSRLCMQDFTESAAYLHCPQPMPVGSALQIQVEDDLEIDLCVEHVHEQVAGSEKPAGMLVGATALEGRALQWWSSHVGAVSAQAASPDDADAPDTEVVDVESPADLAAAEPAREESAPVAAAPEPKDAAEEKVVVEASADDESAGGKGKKRKRRKRR